MRQPSLTRRDLLFGAMSLIPVVRSGSATSWVAHRILRADDPIADIERRVGGRLGVAALDTGSGKRIDYRSNERFPMCSTFKMLAVAAVLTRVDDGRDHLTRSVRYGEADLLDYAPITRQHVQEGGMTLSALCEAAVEYSDNTAANLLLQALGGPSAVTRYARSINDDVTRLDRNEPTLNTALPGDLRDTTNPTAMLRDMQTILLRDVLSAESRLRLTNWLIANTTGAAALRAGLPATWRVGDKTGSGARGATNDIAIIWPPARNPILVASYLTETGAPRAECSAALRDVGKVVAERFG